MKLFGLLAAGAIQLPLQVLSMRTSLGLKETLLAVNKERSVSFALLPFDLPNNTLISQDALTNNDHYSGILGPDGRIGCTESMAIDNNQEITVVLAFSKCLDDTALSTVEEWVNQVKAGITTIAYAEDLKITFQSTMVPGACEEHSEKTKKGLEDKAMENQGGAAPSNAPETTAPDTAKPDMAEPDTAEPHTTEPPVLLTNNVMPTDLKRLEAFPGLGNVVDLADDDVKLDVKPIAVISFVTGEKSYGEVMQYETSVQVSKTFNFHICKSGTNCEGTFENCIDLPEVVDLFMYNPFTVTRSIECANLDGGVPVTYLDDYGVRQCFCNCPAGHVLEENDYGALTCKQVDDEVCPCVWAQVNEFKYAVENDKGTCSFKNFATDSVLSVPFPTDGYVADKRDTLKEGYQNPRITVTAEREQFAEYKGSDVESVVGVGRSLPLTFDEVVGLSSSASNLQPVVAPAHKTRTHSAEYPWKEYQMNRVAHIDDLEFTSYGKYKLEVSAYDYFSSATCDGCLVIVDKYRPKATTECPKSFCDDVADPVHCTESAELTPDNLDKASGLVNQYFDFAIKAKNDACSVDNRCDSESFSRRDFFEKDYTEHDCSQAHQCFNKDTVLEDLLVSTKTKTNPLLEEDNSCDNTDAPVSIGQCTRCCKMHTALKEWWTDYRCGSDYDARNCEGDSDQTCDFKQCLVMNGDTLATVTASITEDAKKESESVLAQVEDEAYQTVTQIHRSLDCTSFGGTDGECEFRAKLSELIETTETLNVASTYSSGQATDYVFWRYKLVSDGESWQLWKTGKQENYGEVTYDNDDVLTFANPETKITIEAWTQCGLVRRFFFYVHLHVNSPVSVCEKFNDMWYQTSVSRLPIGSGMCAYPGSDFAELTFDFHPNAGLQYSREELRMKVSKVECTGALEGRKPIDILSVTQDSPEIVTRFAVAMLNKATTEAATDFHVECVFTYAKYSGASATETCKRDFSISDCKGPAFDTPNSVCEYEACAGQDEAGLYEACGGTVVKADDKCTIVETGEKPCCQGCENTEVTCVALLDLPNTNADIMRCEPSGGGGAYSSPSTSYGAVLLTETVQEHPAATALLGATALIAVVALVVVRRRTVAAHSAQTVDDAYYPLLH